MSDYAWVIDKDHLYDPAYDFLSDAKGVVGPRDANTTADNYDDTRKELAHNYEHHAQFRMYDDDKILYYTGTLYWNGDMDEEYAYAPLGDYGMPGAGAVEIRYTGHSEWDCG
ncbi:hypothetical protein EniyanLRS_145 [Mycobacterium phage EniyanLRS]|uniref:Uncharacterized protein n=2 Tax=Mycobacterium virus Wildcat TaxID=1993859 RepID=A0A0B5A3E4_9CAUD|nr:hypothetical protein COSMO_153 [Mycobacterium phage Cosmo]AQT25794.1 hypothetical protein EniyanLRS_145 [Mycobacterium phage EniyanLRS]WKR36134.1 hypothetical protein [Mycobacterium phage Azrael100]